MNACIRPVIAGFFVLLLAVVAQAGPLKLVFSGGTVSIDADAVPLRAILAEWGRLGGTGIDGIDKLPEVVITLHLAAIAEGEALDALLTGRNGYATVRKKPGEAGASELARIVVFSPTTSVGTADTMPSAVPADWPFPVNEHPEDADRQPPTSEIKIERPGIEIPWPFPINETPEVDTPPPAAPSLESIGIPGIDVPWPFPVNLEPTLQADPPAPAAVTEEIPGIDVPWPFPINPNAVDPDALPPIDAPVTADPQDKAALDKPAVYVLSSDPNKPAPNVKGAPVSTKAPKPIPPRKRPQPKPGR